MNDRPGWKGLLAWVALLFLIVIVAVYYIPHKPFDERVFLSSFRAIKDLIFACAIITLSGGLGRRVLGKLHPNELANLVLQAAFGLGMSALILLGSGLLGLFQGWFIWSLLLIPTILIWRSVLDWLSGLSSILKEYRETTSFPRLLAIISIAILLFRLFEALAPPTHFDALVYHLSLPSEFLESGRFVFTPENPYWGMPLSSELLYTWAMALGRPQTSAVLGWCIGVLTLIGVIGLGNNISRRAGWIAAAALLAGETISSSLGWAYADWGAAMQGVAVLIALDAWRRVDSKSILIAAGLLAGFGFGFKYTAGILIPAGLIFILCFCNRKRFLPALLIFATSAGVILLLWLGKNFIFTSSPLYPFLGSAEWVDPLRTAFFRGTVTPWPILRIILTPLSATLMGVEGAPGFSASIGPLLLGLILGVLFINKDQREFIMGIGLFVLVGWITWACATAFNSFLGQTRLYYAIFPAWALLAAAGFEGFANVTISNIRFERIVGVFVVLSLFFSSFANLQDILRKQPLNAVIGLEEQGVYLTRTVGAYYPAMETIQNLPAGSSVLNLWEPRGFYCRPICLADAWIDRWYLDRQRVGDEQSILLHWQEEGFTHVLLHVAGMEFIQENDARYHSDDWKVLESILQDLTLVEKFGDGYTLYGLIQ